MQSIDMSQSRGRVKHLLLKLAVLFVVLILFQILLPHCPTSPSSCPSDTSITLAAAAIL